MVGDMIYSISFHQFMMLIHTHMYVCMYVKTQVFVVYIILYFFLFWKEDASQMIWWMFNGILIPTLYVLCKIQLLQYPFECQLQIRSPTQI